MKAYETLFVLLRSANSEIRRRTARRVRETIQYIDSSVTRILIDLVSDDSRDVQEEALLALAEIGYRATPTVVAACRMAMHDKYHLIRMCAANALGKLRQSDEATINDLLSALTDSDTRVRLAASEALIALGEGPARAAIIQCVRSCLDEHTPSEDALNTLWGLVVGE